MFPLIRVLGGGSWSARQYQGSGLVGSAVSGWMGNWLGVAVEFSVRMSATTHGHTRRVDQASWAEGGGGVEADSVLSRSSIR